ncbi:unnamed protein product [Ostreobium quekettii]|uniref:Uncharacterized protein n=1 Tax=Ostreobium quekettii TaxID=121088 RepID=A0A8S1J4P0_9CHLO|nr:unnamed protein product [Ostreobium quekettii]
MASDRAVSIVVVDISPNFLLEHPPGTGQRVRARRGLLDRISGQLFAAWRDMANGNVCSYCFRVDQTRLAEHANAGQEVHADFFVADDWSLAEALCTVFMGLTQLEVQERKNHLGVPQETSELMETLQGIIDCISEDPKEPKYEELREALSWKTLQSDQQNPIWTLHTWQEPAWEGFCWQNDVAFMRSKPPHQQAFKILQLEGVKAEHRLGVDVGRVWPDLEFPKGQPHRGLSISDIMSFRKHVKGKIAEKCKQEVDRVTARVIHAMLTSIEHLLKSLACPPEEHLLAPLHNIEMADPPRCIPMTAFRERRELLQRIEAMNKDAQDKDATLLKLQQERSRIGTEPSMQCGDEASLKEINALLRKQLFESAQEVERAEHVANEVRKQLTILQQSQNISGEGDFPLKYQATKMYLAKGVEYFQIFMKHYNKLAKSYDAFSCQMELALEMEFMLQTINRNVQDRYDNLLSGMLNGLHNLEDRHTASKATHSFLALYCQRYWRQLFLGTHANSTQKQQPELHKDSNPFAANAFEDYWNCDKHNTLMKTVASLSIKKPQNDSKGEIINWFESALWKAFKWFWDASVVMFLQRPKLQFYFRLQKGSTSVCSFSQAEHQFIDAACKEGEPVVVIVPAVFEESGTPEMRELSWVLKVENRQRRQLETWPASTLDFYESGQFVYPQRRPTCNSPDADLYGEAANANAAPGGLDSSGASAPRNNYDGVTTLVPQQPDRQFMNNPANRSNCQARPGN